MRKLIVWFTLAITLWFSPLVTAAPYHVATNGDDAADGTNWATAVRTISNGVRLAAAAGAGNTVWVSNGTYVLTTTVNLNADVTVRGFGDNRENVIVDGNANGFCCFYITHASAVLSSLTVTNGMAGFGAGVNISAGLVTNCLITGNLGTNPNKSYRGGGGVFVNGGQVVDSGIVGNICSNATYGSGGGLFLGNGVVSNCVIAQNKAFGIPSFGGGGGAKISYGGTMVDCIISDNYVNGYGGGITLMDSSRISNCVITANQADMGGGGVNLQYIYTPGGTNILTDCVISNNYTGGLGGGICQLNVIHSLIERSHVVNNASYNDAGGLYIRNGCTVDACVVSANTGDTGIANGGAGGIYLNQGGAILNSTIEQNDTGMCASWGGAGIFFSQGGSASNCIIRNNISATCHAGGVYMYLGGRLVNCLVANNYAKYNAGGVLANNMLVNNGGISACTIASNTSGVYLLETNSVVNSIIYHNAGADVTASGAATNAFHYCCLPVLPVEGQNNITNTPLFIDETAGNFRLQPLSPCINAGTNESWMAGSADLDGRPRIDRMAGIADMGCYEHILRGSLFRLR